MVVLRLLAAFIGVVGFGIVLEVQKKYLLYCGLLKLNP